MTVEVLESTYGHHHPDVQEDAAAGVSGRSRPLTAHERQKQTGTDTEKNEAV